MKTAKYIFSFILLLTLFSLGSCRGGKTEEKTVDVVSSLQDVSKLQLARMSVGKVGTITDPDLSDAKTLQQKAAAVLDKMKIGKRIGVYSYDTYLSAYIDLSELTPEDVEIDKENKVARVKLPPVKIEYEGRDLKLKEEHYRVSGLRSNITPAERAALKEQMAAELKKEVGANAEFERSLREAALHKAVQYFSILLRDWGYQPEISFKS